MGGILLIVPAMLHAKNKLYVCNYPTGVFIHYVRTYTTSVFHTSIWLPRTAFTLVYPHSCMCLQELIPCCCAA